MRLLNPLGCQRRIGGYPGRCLDKHGSVRASLRIDGPVGAKLKSRLAVRKNVIRGERVESVEFDDTCGLVEEARVPLQEQGLGKVAARSGAISGSGEWRRGASRGGGAGRFTRYVLRAGRCRLPLTSFGVGGPEFFSALFGCSAGSMVLRIRVGQ